MARLREIQRAHKSDKITVAQAEKAWRKVERESARKAVSRSATTGRFVKKDTAASSSKPNTPKK